jgi:hypothetical protein
LAAQIVMFAIGIAAILNQRSLVQQAISNPGSVTVTAIQDADHRVHIYNGLVVTTFLVTAAVFITWFYLARRNVDAWRPMFQRRARGWAIGGWFCPVVNLWFPFMIASDVILDTERNPDGWGRQQRHSVAIAGIWWASFILTAVLSGTIGRNGAQIGDLPSFVSEANWEIVAICVRIAAIVPAMLLIVRITGSQRRRMEFDANGRPLATWPISQRH